MRDSTSAIETASVNAIDRLGRSTRRARGTVGSDASRERVRGCNPCVCVCYGAPAPARVHLSRAPRLRERGDGHLLANRISRLVIIRVSAPGSWTLDSTQNTVRARTLASVRSKRADDFDSRLLLTASATLRSSGRLGLLASVYLPPLLAAALAAFISAFFASIFSSLFASFFAASFSACFCARVNTGVNG